MPVPKTKSRVRFQSVPKKVKQSGGIAAQRKPIRTVFGSPPEFMLVGDGVNDAQLFARKRVPSTDETGSLLQSNLSSALSARKAHEAQQGPAKLPPSRPGRRIERLQDGYDAPTSLLRPMPTCHDLNACRLTTKGDGSSASIPATTTVHNLSNGSIKLVNLTAVVAERVINDKEPTAFLVQDEKAPLPKTTEARVVVQEGENNDFSPHSAVAPGADLEPAPQTSQVNDTITDSCAISESYATEDGDNFLVPPMAKTYKSFEHVKPVSRSSIAPVQPQKQPPTFQQWMVTLFAGRRRCHPAEEEQPSEQASRQEQQEATIATAKSQLPLPLSRRTTVQFDCPTPPKPVPPKDLPRSAPIPIPGRPYCPIKEMYNAPAIRLANRNKYSGFYYVAPDVFTPGEKQKGFPSAEPPKSPTLPLRWLNSDAQLLLDRDDTPWAKWYAKHTKVEHLPWAKANESRQRREGEVEEATDLQVWNAHAAHHAQFREMLLPPVTDEDLSRLMEDEEDERVDLLRYHEGHCFGAVAGDVYPFHGGRII